MVYQDKKNGYELNLPSLLLIPRVENETARSKFYVYKTEEGNYKVSMPNSSDYYNFEGYEEATMLGEFSFDICYEEVMHITNRPVFAVLLDENRKIMAYQIINDFNEDVSLENYLNEPELSSKRGR